MNQNQLLDETYTGIKNRNEKIPSGTLTKGFFRQIDDIEQYDFEGNNQPSSPTKMIPDSPEIKTNPERSVRRSTRKSKRNIVLQPIKAQRPKKVQITNLDSQQQNQIQQFELEPKESKQILKKEHQKQQENQTVHVQPYQKQSQQKIQQRSKKKTPMLFVASDNSEDQPQKNDKVQEHVIMHKFQQEQNISTIKKLAQIGKQYDFIKGHQSLSFIIRRDKQWLNKLRPIFSLYLLQNNQYFFSAKLTGSNATQTFILSKNKDDFTQNGPNYLGKVKINFTGSQVCVFGPGLSPKQAKQKGVKPRQMLASIIFQTNFFGSTKPRNFKVYLLKPSANYFDLKGLSVDQEKTFEQLYHHEENKNKILVMQNKKPQWNQQINGFMLNFGGKVKKASIKNFILEDQTNPDNTRMLFGKIQDQEFRMEIGNPLSPYVGMGISLSAFGSKIGCE